jgi:hypothetical protein
MPKAFSAVAFGALALGAAVGLPAHAAVPLPVGQAGVVVTLNAADSYRQGVPYDISGYVYAVAALPVVVEEAVGLSNMSVDVLVDGAFRGSLTTNGEGFYQATFFLTGETPTHTIQTAVFRGTPLQVSSPTRSTTIEQVFTALNLSPSNLSLDIGATQQLTAIAVDGDGRQHDVTSSAIWSTGDAAVATVNGGMVEATGGGSTAITATYADLSASTPVNVINNGR